MYLLLELFLGENVGITHSLSSDVMSLKGGSPICKNYVLMDVYNEEFKDIYLVT